MKLEELNAMKSANEAGKGMEIQRNLNKASAKERIADILDEGTFIEIGGLIASSGGGAITGYGTIEGRLVYIFCQDYSVSGGALHRINSSKICNVMDMAAKMGAPLIQIFDSVGGTAAEGLELLSSYASIIKRGARNSGVIPVISVIAGPCTGSAAISALMGDFTIMVKNKGELYINAPETVTKQSKQFASADDYGTMDAASANGIISIAAEDEYEASSYLRKIISMLPSNNLEMPEQKAAENDINQYEYKLDTVASSKEYDINEVIQLLFDGNSITEINKDYGKAVNTTLCRLNGIPVGVIACRRDINFSVLDRDACEKAAAFVKLCDSFNISLISIVDSKGFSASITEEAKGLTKYAAKLAFALASAEVPKISLLIGDAYGASFITLASKDSSFDFCYAWPGARVSLTEPQALINMLHREEILESDNPNEKEKELFEAHYDEATSIKKAAEEGIIDDIIAPGESRTRLFAVLDMLQSKRELNYPRKHGSVLI